MPRYKGIGMPKSKKKAVAQPSEAQEESSAPPAPSEPPAPPSSDSKQVGRKRAAQSPGMRAVKQAACAAKKAARAARIAYLKYLRAKYKELQGALFTHSGSPERHHEVMEESGQQEGLLTPAEMAQGRDGDR